MEGSDAEVSATWPDVYFKDVMEMTLINAGVVRKNSGKTHNPNRCLMVDQNTLGQYMEK